MSDFFETPERTADICKFYLRGACRYGHRCWFSHERPSYHDSIRARIPASTYYGEGESSFRRPYRTASNTRSTSQTGRQVVPSRHTKQERQIDQTNDSGKGTENSPDNMAASVKKEDTAENSKENGDTASQQLPDKRDGNQSVWNENLQSAVDSDLQCNICYEIFIKPTVLNCSHTFCETCIHVWTKRVKKCPICRVHIRSKSLCLTLDSFIEKIVEFMPKDVKDKRAVSIQEHKTKMERMNQRNHLNRSVSMRTLDYFMDNQDEDIEADTIIEEAEMFRMNLHDTVVSTGGINPLMRYMVPRENMLECIVERYVNSFVRH